MGEELDYYTVILNRGQKVWCRVSKSGLLRGMTGFRETANCFSAMVSML